MTQPPPDHRAAEPPADPPAAAPGRMALEPAVPALESANAVGLSHLIFAQSMDDTRATLRSWRAKPLRVATPWIAGAAAIALTLLAGTWLVAISVAPDTGTIPFVVQSPGLESGARVMLRNLLVLALHAFVCIAGFMAMQALPEQAKSRTGIDRWIHHHATKAAMVWVAGATAFSIATQIYVLGSDAAGVADSYGVSPGRLLLTVLPHALPELTAVFLPLAAFLVASRTGRWNELLAATAATVMLALPVLILSAAVETYVWPALLESISAWPTPR